MKGNVFLGTARGKLGDLVLSRRNGKQVGRIRVYPKNPQTDQQVIRRLAMSTSTKMASALSTILTHSFQGVRYGQTSINHFVKDAAKTLGSYAMAAYNGQYYDVAPLLSLTASNLGVCAPLKIASGDLDVGNLAATVSGKGVKLGVSGTLGSANITGADFVRIFGIPYTDQITFVVGKVVEDESAVDAASVMGGIQFYVMRLNFKTDVDDTTVLFNNSNSIFTIESHAVDEERSTPGIEGLSIANGNFVLNAFTGDTASYAIGAIIVSRYQDGKWRRSNAFLTCAAPSGIESTLDGQSSFGWNVLQDLIDISRKGQSASETEYLNKKKI